MQPMSITSMSIQNNSSGVPRPVMTESGTDGGGQMREKLEEAMFQKMDQVVADIEDEVDLR